MSTDIRALNRRAVMDSVRLAATAGPRDLVLPTPCAAWNLGQLLGHMAAQHRGFAAAADGRGESSEVWQVRDDVDPVADHQAAALEVLEAFGPDEVLERRFSVPEITTAITFSGRVAIGFHLIDYVAHSWDVARSLGLQYRPDDELLDAALVIAGRVPDGPERNVPGAAFGPGIAVGEAVAPMDRLLAMLGRSPTWPDAS